MPETFKAIRLEKNDDKTSAALAEVSLDELMEGDVVVDVDYSTVNYKDGLAITGASPVVRTFPMIPGIDLAGTVVSSGNSKFKPGDRVVQNGFGLSESHFGGYAAKARVKSEWLVKCPDSISNAQAMAIGTAGYTAMLCVMALEKAGLQPSDGPIVVTGAAGGVGSVSVALLAKLGFEVIASTGRTEEEPYLKALGASSIIERKELSEKGRPLGKERWAGGVDSVGSQTLANVLAATKYDGAVAACGLAQGADLPATVMPFILRSVSLLGVDSVMAPLARREEAWSRLAKDLDLSKLEAMTTTIGLGDVIGTAGDILAGKVRGRYVVDVRA